MHANVPSLRYADTTEPMVYSVDPAASRPVLEGGRLLAIGAAIFLTVLIGFCDKITGWEFSLIIFYSIPILMVVWQDQKRFAVFFAFMCGVVWWLANMRLNPYHWIWSYHWAAAGRTFYFVLLAVGGNSIRAKQVADRELINRLINIRKLERDVLKAGEEEQHRIARDLHDGLCQQLAAIGYAARSLADDLQARSVPESKDAEKIEEHLRDSVDQVRDTARGLFPELTGEGGLAAALNELAAMTKHMTRIKVSFRKEGDVHMENAEAALHLYRIAQQAMNNALRHSHGTEVVISLQREGETVRLAVTDDGVGLPQSPKASTGMGLKTMDYRAGILGTTLEIREHPPHGTLVACVCNMNTQPHHG